MNIIFKKSGLPENRPHPFCLFFETDPNEIHGLIWCTTEDERNRAIKILESLAGGESQGIKWAAENAKVLVDMYAINHWERAIETHQANFPDAEHICRDVQDLNPSELIPERNVALLWASPACTHFSVARGGKPCDDQSRITPFTVLDWLEKLVVKRVIIENVPEFTSWGPLDEETRRPIKEEKGKIFNAYIDLIRGLGYTVDWKVLNAADYGAPTTRRRLFIQAVRAGSGKSILWPEATHLQPSPNQTLIGDLPSWVPARDIIDWSLPTQIIDDRKRPLAENTIKRICRGIEKYWGDYATPFLIRYNGGDNRVHSVDEPLPVLDTSNRYGLVEPLIMHIGQTSAKGRVRSIDEPLATVVTKEEACLIEPLFIPQHSCGEVRPTNGPLSTVATSGAIGLVEPLLMEYYGQSGCHPVSSKPIPPVTTNNHFALITPEPLLMKYYGQGVCHPVSSVPVPSIMTSYHLALITPEIAQQPEPLIMEYYGHGECQPVSKPLRTVTTKDRFALISPENVRLGFRMLKPHELAAAQSFPDDYIFTGNRADVLKQIGNAVCPKISEALTQAYMQELAGEVSGGVGCV